MLNEGVVHCKGELVQDFLETLPVNRVVLIKRGRNRRAPRTRSTWPAPKADLDHISLATPGKGTKQVLKERTEAVARTREKKRPQST
eukprot:scaffold1137_cov392-Pavlova_lutheri.AAC.22